MKHALKTFICPLILFAGLTLKAQNEARFWYFGTKAGLDFSTAPPTVLTTGSVSTGEGSAVMSDSNGSLLFYTDGVTVYNQNHAVMANGTGLMGDFSTTQSAIIVRQPLSPNLYYLFTLDDSGSQGYNGLYYSIVDMSLAAGMGSVTVKNSPLQSSSTEKMAAVKHCNGTDVWVITHDLTTNTFRTYLLTSSGINGFTLSNAGNVVETIGQMKVSPNGRKLAVAGFGLTGGFVLYDFDPATGAVSNPLPLSSSYYAYGCEFSPDGTRLYGTDHVTNEVYQWDLCAGSNAAIVASQYTITAPAGNPYMSGMQLGPDKKIYIAIKYQQGLSVIANPNALGAACNYQHMSQSIAPKANGMGLPAFVSSQFKPAPSPFTHTVSCQNASFTAGPPNAACSAAGFTLSGVQWLFGDPASGNNNSASGNNATHNFSGPGTYSVKCVYVYQCSADTVLIPVTVAPGSVPALSIAGTFTICKGDTRTYTVSGANAYSWSNASTAPVVALSPTATTVYTVTGTNTGNGCQANKTMTVTVNNCTGMAELKNTAGNVRAYPNPFEESLHIHSEQVATLVIFNQLGSPVLEIKLSPGDHDLDTSGLPAGFYQAVMTAEGLKTNLRLVKTGR